ncbi:MAG: EAL domain-containing protein [Aquificaceae bacterium]|nr:EAL domain-containing protein [Aquificaceae bacterium]
MIVFSLGVGECLIEPEKLELIKKSLQEELGEEVDFKTFKSFEEEYAEVEEGPSCQLYLSRSLVCEKLYHKGYMPVSKPRGKPNRYLLVAKDEVPEEGQILVALPFFKPAGFVLSELDFHRVVFIYTDDFRGVLKLLREGNAHLGVVCYYFWQKLPEEERTLYRVLEDKTLEISHLVMAVEPIAEKVKRALLSSEYFEPADEGDMVKIAEVHSTFERLAKKLSYASIAEALKKDANVAVMIYNDKLVYVNNAFTRLTGYTSEELENIPIGDLVLKLFYGSYAELFLEEIEKRLSGLKFLANYNELAIKTKNGDRAWAIASSETIVFGGKNSGVVFLTDITKKKRFQRLYEILREINYLITHAVEEGELLKSICKVVVDKLGVNFAWVGIYEPRLETIQPIYYYGKNGKYLSMVTARIKRYEPIQDDIVIQAFVENRVQISYSTTRSLMSEHVKESMLSRNYISSCSIPIVKGDKPLYSLNLYSDETNFFQEENREVIEEMKEDIEFALRRLEEIRKNTILGEALKSSHSWVLVTNEDGKIVYVNETVCSLSGYSKEEILGNTLRMFEAGYHGEEFHKTLWNTLRSGEQFRSTFIYRSKDGTVFYLDQTLYPVKLPDGEIMYMAVGRDISKELYLSSEVERLTFVDPATGLLNLEGFKFKVMEKMSSMKQGDMYAFVILDIYNFSFINKNYGIDVGDKLLSLVAQRLREKLPDADTLSRVAGDEFGFLLGPFEEERQIMVNINLLLESFKEPFRLGDVEIITQVNMGVCLISGGRESFGDVYGKADIALKNAKLHGEGAVKFFQEDMDLKARDYQNSTELVYRALKEKLFVFYYQPYFRSKDLSVAGYEALVRIKDREGHIYTPHYFIEYLEGSVLLKDFQRWAFEEVLLAVEKLGKPVTVNVPPRVFEFDTLFEDILKRDIKGRLALEITERALFKLSSKNLELLSLLRTEKGIKILVDDFGTGYSSLSYIVDLPIDIIKVDISFVRKVGTDQKARKLVRSIVELAEVLGLETVAEGVETEEQLAILRDMGVTYLQGFLLCKPLPLEETCR